MPTLIITNGSIANPQSLDLSQYLNLQDQSPTDPAAPAFTDKVWARSVLREGAVLSMEQTTEKELIWDLFLKAANTTALHTLIEQINAIIETPGCVCEFQNDGASQPTYFDGLTGQLDITFDYWKTQSQWTEAKLRFFAEPFGRPASSRTYATASGIGPLLMISPYASGGALSVAASTQNSVAGFGGKPAGASTGVFYWGSPSLAGDAPAMMQISYVGPLPNKASMAGVVPNAIVSLLPDPLYRPLISASEINAIALFEAGGLALINTQTAVASTYRHLHSAIVGNNLWGAAQWLFNPLPQASYSAQDPGLPWAGQHRLLAIARASATSAASQPAYLFQNGPLTTYAASVAIPHSFDWGLYDLGTFSLRPSEMPNVPITVSGFVSGSQALDLTALVMLPDNSTWFLNGANPVTYASTYGVPSAWAGGGGGSDPNLPAAPYTNTLLMDDVLNDQLIYSGASQTSAPSPLGSVPSSARITHLTRGLIPRPDPKNGTPIIAILGVAQNVASPLPFVTALPQIANANAPGASWTNAQNLPSYAQVNVLERSRYLLS